ncbi:tRNA pseudouridine(55) synthase TruB [Polyangium jinanense]|uniref:tRNA pseudouridine(55) synthase TruB n=1 Tax=Polyangium jinanense TaxID=2829994 RepID=UPI0023414364|nr:tRNA pseudouridine(55) synthase TruB [Polyangium jinanense]MDC3961821.1 tRNA pseudouridine(55) synthase TruB [Polyangium jinanense]
MSPKDRGDVHGVLVLDKPKGPTSHDVVGKLRRALGMRRIGHAGTLDPMASGVLVMLLGEATKLGPYLTAHDKAYEARVVLGRGTDTLDAEGAVTAEAPLPAWLEDEITRFAQEGASAALPRITAALDHERARTEQAPPAYSAIKVDGAKSYDRARRGEVVELPARPVAVRAIELRGAGILEPGKLAFLDVSLDVSKGYYVRSLARDLGAGLTVPAHLGALRRTRSGPFGLDVANVLDAPGEALRAAVVPLAAAVRLGLPTAVLTAEGAVRASQGKRLGAADFSEPPPREVEIQESPADRLDEPSELEASGTSAWLSPEGRLVAVGKWDHDGYVVQRGFTDVPAGREVETEKHVVSGRRFPL